MHLQSASRLRACVVGHPFFKEVRLALERNEVHEIEGIGDVIVSRVTKRIQEMVGNEFDVLEHRSSIQTKKCNRECFCEKMSGRTWRGEGADR